MSKPSSPAAIGAWIAAACFALVSATGPATLAAPPKVIETIPAADDDAVDPRTTELRIVFDQPMDPGAGYSLAGGGPTFPEVTGQARWIDERTIAVPIRLSAGRPYVLGVNSATHRNFRSAAGEPAEPFDLRFSAADGEGRQPLTPELNARALEQARLALRERYSHRDVHKADWDVLFEQHGPALTGATSRIAFARRLAEVLAAAGDVHITVAAGGHTFATHRPRLVANVDGRSLARLVPGFTKHNDSLYSGRFEDGAGYVMIASWEAARGADATAVIDVLRSMADAPGIVLDVRPNTGGDERIAQPVAGCFVEAPVVYARQRYVDPARPDGFGDESERVLQPNADGPRLRQPVAVLMGGANLSSAEGFLLMMKQAPRARLIGARSYGSSGNPKPIELGNGVSVFLPSWQTSQPEGSPLEGAGIEPHIAVEALPETLRQRDPVLERALAWLRTEAASP